MSPRNQYEYKLLSRSKEEGMECGMESDGLGESGRGREKGKTLLRRNIIFGILLFAAGWSSRSATSPIAALRATVEKVPPFDDTYNSGNDTLIQDMKQNTTIQHTLHSHTYSNCPFTLTKFSQFELSHEGPYMSDTDRMINSEVRGKMAMDFSNNRRAYERVVQALESGAFHGRKIVLDGDSLTRQLFISLGCLAWSAGYVDNYEFKQEHVTEGKQNLILNNANIEASSKMITRAFIHLKGGGKIYYVANPIKEKIIAMTDTMVNNACDASTASSGSEERSRIPYRARYSFNMDESLHLRKRDVHVLAAGHHEERDLYISAYKRMFECMINRRESGTLGNWPHIMYQLSSVESFWTETGMYGDELIKGADQMSCQINPTSAPHRDEERDALEGLVDFIGDSVNLQHLGQFHVWHGDCLHWLQPGIPDIYAAELADYLLASS